MDFKLKDGVVDVWCGQENFTLALLSRYLDVSPSALNIEKTDSGKPYCVNDKGLHFNVSHTGSYYVVAVALQMVGVDMEACDRKIDCVGIAERFFGPKEARFIRDLSEEERLGAFIEMWTVKEAVIKALGVKISDGMDYVEIENTLVSSRFDGQPIQWCVTTSSIVERKYRLSVATQEAHRMNLQWWRG